MLSNFVVAVLTACCLLLRAEAAPMEYCADSITVDSTYLFPEEFTYAGDQRVTFLGGTPRRETEIQPIPTIMLGLGYAGIAVGLHINQSNAWWKDNRGPFNIQEDWPYALQVDKLGHIWAGYAMSTLLGDMLMECGVAEEPSVLVGSALGLAYQTYVEVEDGYAQKWGFSPSDAISNALGAGFRIAQYYSPVLQNFTPRWSYVPSNWVGDRGLNSRPKTFIDDYNSTTFWLACDVERLLPAQASHYWPDWMMLSVGYGIRDYEVVLADGTSPGPTSRFMVGIDYNWVRILPPLPGLLNWVRQSLNYLRLPGPTLEMGPNGTRFHFLYPFRITIVGIPL
jgi:Predicted periplasmic lipoprotein (DUF2279)